MGQIVIALAIGAAIVIGLSVAPLGISRRGGLLLVGAAVLALVTTVDIALLAAVAVLAAFFATMPPATSPGDFPGDVLWDFRISAVGTQAVLWAGSR